MSDIFSEPQMELTFLVEDRRFGEVGKACPTHGTRPFLMRQGKRYRVVCAFVCSNTTDWEKDAKTATRLWNMNVILMR